MHPKFNDLIKFRSFETFERRFKAYQYTSGYTFSRTSTLLKKCHVPILETNEELNKTFKIYFAKFTCTTKSPNDLK